MTENIEEPQALFFNHHESVEVIAVEHLKIEDGAEIYYRTQGAGHPLVCVHGFGADSSVFRLTEKILSRYYLVVTMDLRGHGRSTVGANGLSFEEMSKDIRKLVDYLGLGNITLLGWSMGGVVVMEYIERFGGENLKNLILVETSPKVINDDKWQYGLFKGEYTLDMAEYELINIRNDFEGFSARLMKRMAPDMDKENLVISIDSMKRNNPDYMAKVWSNIIAADYREILKAIDIPCLVISGKDSTFYGDESGQYVAGMIDKGIHLSIKGGHLAPIESPVEFNRAVMSFIENEN